MATEQGCKDGLLLFGDLDQAIRRLELVGSSVTHLMRFRKTLDTIAMDRQCAKRYPNLRRHIADRAFEAERHSRLASGLGLEAMNQLRDSGRLKEALRDAVAELEKVDDPVAFMADQLGRAKAFFKENLAGVDTEFLDEAVRLQKKLDMKVGTHKGKITVQASLPDNKPVRFQVNPEAKSGGIGRVSTAEFFGGPDAREVLKTLAPIWTEQDCHHRNQWDIGLGEGRDVDVYGAYVGSLKNHNELLYHYARRVDEVGTAYLNGRDPLTAILVGLGIVAAALIIAGVVIEVGCATGAWSGGVCSFGLWLIIVGVFLGAGVVCVAVGACELVLAVIGVAV